jgi:transcriptional regulator GlxA family with amidase domain
MGATMARVMTLEERWEHLAEAAGFEANKLAKLCGVSPRQLRRVFQRCLGRSPQAWLDEMRVWAAQDLLLAGQPVKDVAWELGFKQSSHFCRKFKERFNLTPTAFVALNMGGDSVRHR